MCTELFWFERFPLATNRSRKPSPSMSNHDPPPLSNASVTTGFVGSVIRVKVGAAVAVGSVQTTTRAAMNAVVDESGRGADECGGIGPDSDRKAGITPSMARSGRRPLLAAGRSVAQRAKEPNEEPTKAGFGGTGARMWHEVSCRTTTNDAAANHEEFEMNETDTYILGRTERETRRLILQHQVYGAITRRFFQAAGIGAGMKVLDLGSGAGDVAMLAADLVGPGGKVVGVDM